MSANIDKEHPPTEDWQVSILRVTAFPAPNTELDEQNWWEQLAGDKPDEVKSQPRTGQRVEEGKFENGQLHLSVQPLRIDWHYAAVDDMAINNFQISSLGSFVDALEIFQPLMNTWLRLPDVPSIIRLAFGSVLIQPIEDQKQGYEILSTFLPFDIDTRITSEFLYQANRRRTSSANVSDLTINRLTKWSVPTIGQIAFGVAGGSIRQVESPRLPVCRLELDINTVPEFKDEFSQDMLQDIFAELIEMGKEIAREGDIS